LLRRGRRIPADRMGCRGDQPARRSRSSHPAVIPDIFAPASPVMSESSLTVWLKGSALARMTDEADKEFPRETGGVLMGYWSNDTFQAVITHVIGPGPNAVHHLDSFTPDGEFQLSEIERIYRESGRIITYLGDWHTHPIGGGEPSKRDRKTLRKIASDPEARAPNPLMAILDRKDGWRETVWVLLPPDSGMWRANDLSLRSCGHGDHREIGISGPCIQK